MKFKERTLSQIADMICGNVPESFFEYRSSKFITEFFQDCDTDYRHDGSTRGVWVADTLRQILDEPSASPNAPSDAFIRVISTLMDQGNAHNESSDRPGALATLNAAIARENLQAFYGTDNKCYLRIIGSSAPLTQNINPHRPFTEAETKRREILIEYLDSASEDDLIEKILLPLFRQLGFQRITAAGHKDKALEYGKDIWMKFALPTQHTLYFGLQVKKDKIDSSGVTKTGNANVAELHNQAIMMLGHEIFDPEIGKKVLVDHAFIVSGGEITKAARNWLGGKLDATKRSQILFLDRDDILTLYAITNLRIPSLKTTSTETNDLPF